MVSVLRFETRCLKHTARALNPLNHESGVKQTIHLYVMPVTRVLWFLTMLYLKNPQHGANHTKAYLHI